MKTELSRVRVTFPTLTRADLVERLKVASNRLKEKLPVTRIILYGSYATNRYTAASDIDLLIVYDGPKRKDAYQIAANELRLPRLEARVYTENEYRALLKDSPKLASVLITEAISIFGEAGLDGREK